MQYTIRNLDTEAQFIQFGGQQSQNGIFCLKIVTTILLRINGGGAVRIVLGRSRYFVVATLSLKERHYQLEQPSLRDLKI